MPFFSKDDGPFATAQRKDDILKKKIDSTVKESDKVIKNIKMKNRSEKLVTLYTSCEALEVECKQHLELMNGLAEKDETKPIKDYEKKKIAEIQKIVSFHLKLKDSMSNFPSELQKSDGDEDEKGVGDNDEKARKDEDADNDDDDDKKDDKKKKKDKKIKKGKVKKDKGTKEDEYTGEEVIKEEDVGDNSRDDFNELTETDKTTAGEGEDDDEVEDDDEDDNEDDEDGEEDEDKDDEEEGESEQEGETDKIAQEAVKPVAATRTKIGAVDSRAEPHDTAQTSEHKKHVSREMIEEGDPTTVAVAKLRPDQEYSEEEETEEEYEEDDDDEEDETEEEEEEDDEEEDGEDDGEDGEDQEENDDETSASLPPTMRQYEAISDYKGSMAEDLSFKQGEILTIINTLKSDWWEAMNSKGLKGLVPRNFLTIHREPQSPKDEPGDGEEDDVADKEEDDEENDQEDDDDDDDDDDEEEEGDEQDDGAKDEIPEEKKLKRSRSASDNWRELQRAVTETSISDMLHAMGAVPSGFRPSTLAMHIRHDETYRMVHYLAPKLNVSNLAYSDLRLDISKNKIKTHPVRIGRILRLRTCKQIPSVGAGMEVLSRHVRVCLFDEENILSNIHCVKVAAVDKSQKTWTFNSKVTDTMDTQQHADIFIRTNSAAEKIGVLLELCVTCVRTSTSEVGEVSCGWVHIPLIDDTTGHIIASKTFETQVSGGTPYEEGVEVDPSISRRASSSMIVSMLSGNKQPMLSVRLISPTAEQKELLQTLPETLVGNASLLHFYSFYRQLLADSLIRDRLDLDSTEAIHSPVLVNFPEVADQHDIMNMIRAAWVDRQRSVRRSEKDPNTLLRDEEYMKELFCQVFMDTAYPLMYMSNLPAYHTVHLNSDKTRDRMLQHFNLTRQQQQLQHLQHHQQEHCHSALAVLNSSEFSFTPFSMSEVSYCVLNKHCMPRRAIQVETIQ